MITTNAPNREAWLTHLAQLLRPRFVLAGYTLPENIKLTCGFPSKAALGKKTRRVGEVWRMEASAAGVYEVFVSPLIDDPQEVAAIVAHELVHTAVGLKVGHGAKFKKCAAGVGLVAPFKQPHSDDAFKRWFKIAQDDLGDYPHGRLQPVETSGPKKQTARLIKVSCPLCEADGEPYIVRAAAKTIARGTPHCPVHMLPMVAEIEGEQPDDREGIAAAPIAPPIAPPIELAPIEPAPARPSDPPPLLARNKRPAGERWAGAERWDVFLEMQAPQLGCGQRTVWAAIAGQWVHLARGDRQARISAGEWRQLAQGGRRLEGMQ